MSYFYYGYCNKYAIQSNRKLRKILMNKEFYFLFIGKKENKVFKIKLEVY